MLDSAGMARFSSSPIPLSLGFMLGLAASNQNNSEGTGKAIPVYGVTGGTKASKVAHCCPLKVLVSKLGGEKCQVSPRVTGDAVSFVVSLFLSLRKPAAQALGSQGGPEAISVFYRDERRPAELLALAMGTQRGPWGPGFVSPPALPSWLLSAPLCNLNGHKWLALPGGALRGGRELL